MSTVCSGSRCPSHAGRDQQGVEVRIEYDSEEEAVHIHLRPTERNETLTECPAACDSIRGYVVLYVDAEGRLARVDVLGAQAIPPELMEAAKKAS